MCGYPVYPMYSNQSNDGFGSWWGIFIVIIIIFFLFWGAGWNNNNNINR